MQPTYIAIFHGVVYTMKLEQGQYIWRSTNGAGATGFHNNAASCIQSFFEWAEKDKNPIIIIDTAKSKKVAKVIVNPQIILEN